ncbi:MAG: endonuclease III [Armatimonadetes bacterium]|nr:endonuclease III [Armatimonadota bacterium]NIM24024.1 endonuclease III [Armatimonadota bacterium]NIM67874.1 endonuclease III [Armatimonadota bacterium]NIM76402.1 endonuclease III [Armatimonadota bacterium]NIN06104.1 endonuclease III [Armatimonadota bacterium]
MVKKADFPVKSAAGLKKRARRVVEILRRTYPDAWCTLNFKTSLQLLISTILSAQCTDERVNALTPGLFAKYRSAADWAKAPLSQVEEDIRPAGFFRNKAKNIVSCCQDMLARFGGEVPDRMEDLVTLAGVGRKTANVLLATVWHHPAVIVDTHVQRVSQRLGLATEKNADKIELELQALLPKEDWTFYSHSIIFHGRRICTAKKPDCPGCPLNRICPSASIFGTISSKGRKK